MEDILMTGYEDDIKLSEDGDIALTDETNEDLRQIIYNRLNTQHFDWYHHLYMGANLEEMIGKPNTKVNGEEIKRRIAESLSYQDYITKKTLFEEKEFEINVIPVDNTSLLIVVKIESNNMYINFSYLRGIDEVGYL